MKSVPTLLFAATLLFTQACSSLQPSGSRVLMIDKSNSRVVTFPGNLRGAYFIDKNSKVKFCAEPAPDVARESFRELSAKISANIDANKNLDTVAQSRLEAKALELAGRTELLLVAREMLYRACELSLNNNISESAVLTLYTNVSGLIKSLALKDQNEAAKALNISEIELNDSKKELFKAEERALEQQEIRAKRNANKAFAN